MKKKIILVLIIGVALFEAYSLFPILFYKWNNLPWSIIFKDRNWIEITNKANKYWYSIPRNDSISEIYWSEFTKKLLLIEDKQFKSHYWINLRAKTRALRDNLITLWISSWGSTITEQYIKNKYFVFNKRSFLQKIRELNDSFVISFFKSKEEILAEYLDTIYFWDNIWWIYWAIDKYFNKKSLLDLNDEEINILLTKVRLPWVDFSSERFMKYYNKVKSRAKLKFERKYFILNPKRDYDLFPFVSRVALSKERFINKRLTIDKKLQEEAENIVFWETERLKEKNVNWWASIWIIPYTREILFYVWWKNFEKSEVDLVKNRNLVWSTLKPFLYLLAMEKWASPDSYLIDFRANIEDSQKWSHYISRNYNLKEYWAIKLKEALWNSLNNTAIRLIEKIWVVNFYNFMENIWANFNSSAFNLWPGIVLWTAELSLENLATCYISLIPDLGYKKWRKLNIFYEKNAKKEDKNDVKSEKIMLENILKNPNNRGISFGTKSILNTSVPQAVKTWTSNDFKDNLVISYSKDLIVWVWVWNIENESMLWVTGITWAWKIWHNIIEKAISLWYISENSNEYKNEKIEEFYSCLDKECVRKERSIKRKNDIFYSFDRDKIIDDRDFFIAPTKDEILKLKLAGFTINSQY